MRPALFPATPRLVPSRLVILSVRIRFCTFIVSVTRRLTSWSISRATCFAEIPLDPSSTEENFPLPSKGHGPQLFTMPHSQTIFLRDPSRGFQIVARLVVTSCSTNSSATRPPMRMARLLYRKPLNNCDDHRRKLHGHAECTAARNNRDLMHRIRSRQEFRHQRMACFMIGCCAFFFIGEHHALPFRNPSGTYLFISKSTQPRLPSIQTSRPQRRFVD